MKLYNKLTDKLIIIIYKLTLKIQWTECNDDLEASEPKWSNYILNIIEVNSLRLGNLYLSKDHPKPPKVGLGHLR